MSGLSGPNIPNALEPGTGSCGRKRPGIPGNDPWGLGTSATDRRHSLHIGPGPSDRPAGPAGNSTEHPQLTGGTDCTSVRAPSDRPVDPLTHRPGREQYGTTRVGAERPGTSGSLREWLSLRGIHKTDSERLEQPEQPGNDTPPLEQKRRLRFGRTDPSVPNRGGTVLRNERSAALERAADLVVSREFRSP